MSPKRHPSLESLSYDHHDFLAKVHQINRIIEGEDAKSIREAIADFLEFWKFDGEPHIREEEEILYPLYIQHVPNAKHEIASLQTDHNWFREKFEELTDLPPHENCVPLLKSISNYIISHIRHEEKIFYDRIQELLSEDLLLQLGKDLLTFRSVNRRMINPAPENSHLPDTDLLNRDLER